MSADVKIYAKSLEQEAINQIEAIAEIDAFDGASIRIMPDAHAGAGCVIGFTANLGDKVVPNLVGVDIGCGIYLVELPYRIEDYQSFDSIVKRMVPSGFNVHRDEVFDVKVLGLICYDELKNIDRLNRSIGTLGGGNHFIEVDESEEGCYLVIHTGSRNLGLQVANIYQRKAIEYCRADVPKDLRFLTGELTEQYLHDMRICQSFAQGNRVQIALNVCREAFGQGIDGNHVVHNYIGDDNIIRKGAISAYEGELVLIPLNMRDGSIYGVGKGNADWNYSAPHGAGRAMSRRKARESIDVDRFVSQMDGIYTTTANESTVDEAPDAYKPSDEIIEALEPTVEIISRLYPKYNFKAGKEW